MYNSNDIQKMLETAKEHKDLFFEQIDNSNISTSDKASIKSVINECWYECFDRFDSAVCDHFITIYEKARC